MKQFARVSSLLAAMIMVSAAVLKMPDWELLSFQRDPLYRNWSGGIVLAMILFQWGLTLGRAVFRRKGGAWNRWVDWHLRIAVVLPVAVLAHSIAIGFGLLAMLPLALLSASYFGTRLDGAHEMDRFLRYHVILSALTLAMSLVHLHTVVWFR